MTDLLIDANTIPKRRLRVEWKPQDLWVGLFWKRRTWYGGHRSSWQGDKPGAAHQALDWWLCLVPMVPIHFASLVCPRPDVCRSSRCWAKVGVLAP